MAQQASILTHGFRKGSRKLSELSSSNHQQRKLSSKMSKGNILLKAIIVKSRCILEYII
jgi:hypothetical protein